MARLDHPAIARVLLQYGEENGFHFFAMEYAGGGDLRKAVLEERLSGSEALAQVKKIGEALGFAHDQGVVHRDIKPANILLTEDGQPKLTDFDLVLAPDTTGMTRTGGGMGTFLYSAPEILQNASRADARADIYSLAMTAVFALSGAELTISTLRDPIGFLANLKVSDPTRTALARATALDPKDRFSSIQEFLEALEIRANEPKPAIPLDFSKTPEWLAFQKRASWAGPLFESLRRDNVAVLQCEESENGCCYLRLRFPQHLRELYGLAPQVLLLAAPKEVLGGDLQQAKVHLYRKRFDFDLDLLLVTDGRRG